MSVKSRNYHIRNMPRKATKEHRLSPDNTVGVSEDLLFQWGKYEQNFYCARLKKGKRIEPEETAWAKYVNKG
jgi:hypothetical protein